MIEDEVIETLDYTCGLIDRYFANDPNLLTRGQPEQLLIDLRQYLGDLLSDVERDVEAHGRTIGR